MMQKHNFNSGPAMLPPIVLQQAAAAVIDYNNLGLSLLEIGHRTKWFESIIEEAKTLVKELMQLGDDYAVLFLQGGATMQFMQIPLNLLNQNATAGYCDNGVWGSKAIQEAAIFGKIEVLQSTKAQHYQYIQKNFPIPTDLAYLHLTSNNTVEGTQWQSFPKTELPLIADMSSDILSKPLDFKQFSLIYAGAQKNLGAAGVTMVIIKKNLLGKVDRKISPILDYRKHIEANSLMNTPPVFAIYVVLLTLRWIKASGGLTEMEKRASARAQLLYDTIHRLPLFHCPIAVEDRSQMNAVFFIQDEALQTRFLTECAEHQMIGVKGYRTVGGIRVSMYNAMPYESIVAFTDLMKNFAQKNS